MRSKFMLIGVGIVIGALLSAAIAWAGNLNPAAGPAGAASRMYTLNDIYNRIDSGITATKQTQFTEPASGPTAGTMRTLDDLYTLAGQRSLVAKTGQTTCYNGSFTLIPCAGTRQDGAWQKGVAWPNPRFITSTRGVVTDTLTGLVWLKNANCFGQLDWTSAMTAANTLNSGECGLSDGSVEGDWRLPNVRELYSLVHYGYYNPSVPNTAGTGQWTEGNPFTAVQSFYYWSATTFVINPPGAWRVGFDNGPVWVDEKPFTYYVWPVRGGH